MEALPPSIKFPTTVLGNPLSSSPSCFLLMSLSSRDRDLQATGPKLFWWLLVSLRLWHCYAHLGWERKVSCFLNPTFPAPVSAAGPTVVLCALPPPASYHLLCSRHLCPLPPPPSCPLQQTLNAPHMCSCSLLFSHPVKQALWSKAQASC